MSEKSKDTKAFEAQVMKDLREHPQWKIRTDAGLWVCPYCAALGAHWASEPQKMMAELLGHLFYQCPKFNRGKGYLKPLDELKFRARLYNLSKRIKHDGAFQVLDRERRWYSPITGLRQPFILKEDRPSRSELMLIQKHLDENPLTEGDVPLSREQLETSVKIHTDSRFRCFDTLGRWYNPFTLKPTDVMLDESRRITRAQIIAIHERLANGIEFATYKGIPPNTLENVQDAVSRGDKRARLARDIKAMMRSDTVWTVMGSHGYWKCPFCREEIHTVHINSPFLLKEIAPRQMAAHLVDECNGYKQSVAPATSVSELGGTPLKSDALGPARAQYEAAAATFDAMEKSREDQAAIQNRILEARHSEGELEKHREVQKHQKQVMERARQVQLGMLPKLPDIPGLEIVAHYSAMDEVGGDFYDFVEVGPNELGIVMGDVSGHGVHAALVMAAAKKSVKIHGKGISSPRETMMIVNDDLRPELPPSIFVTIFYGVLNLVTKSLTFVRCGHNPLLIFNPSRQEKLLSLEPGGMIVGMAPSVMFGKTLKEETVHLRPGDIVLQYTDGVTEAMDPENTEYGEERLADAFEKFETDSLQDFIDRIVTDVEDFRNGAEVNDDVTLLAFRVMRGAAKSAGTETAETASESTPTAPVSIADSAETRAVALPPAPPPTPQPAPAAASVASNDIDVEVGDIEAEFESNDAILTSELPLSASTASMEFTPPGSQSDSAGSTATGIFGSPIGDFAPDDPTMLPTGFDLPMIDGERNGDAP